MHTPTRTHARTPKHIRTHARTRASGACFGLQRLLEWKDFALVACAAGMAAAVTIIGVSLTVIGEYKGLFNTDSFADAAGDLASQGRNATWDFFAGDMGM